MREHHAMGEALRIRLFGEPHFEFGGQAYAFSAPPKTLPLLAFLLLNRRAASARETIATALWPDSEREESLANVRRHLHYLNKALPAAPHEPWILTTARTVQWNAACAYELDVETFEAESQDRQYRPHAVRLYSGDLYERCGDEWIYFERERLRSMQMSNLALLASEARSRKAYLQALQYAQLMLALDPWREDALRSVLEIRGLLGDASGAAAEYERFAKRLNEELGVAPGDDTRALYDRLRRSGARAAEHDAAASAQTQQVAGRRNELAVLADEWNRARQGRCRLLLIGGEAGIGKTTLLEALAGTALADEASVFRGAAAPDTPYQAFIDILRSSADVSPSLRELAGRGPGSGDERLQFFEAIAAVLQNAAHRPLLVLLEDLHFAGGATLDLLRFLVTRLERAPILFAASYRDYEVDRSHPLRAIRRQLARSGHLTHLAVTPLDRESTRELLQSRSPRPLSDESVERIFEAAGGNPLFMIETLHQFARGKPEEIPATVSAMVRERIESLDAQARAVVESAAVAGRHCTAELITETTGLREAEVLRAFDTLVERHVLRECLAGEPAEFAFAHDLIRQSAYEQIPKEALKRKHARTGIALRELNAENIDEIAGVLARHFELGAMHGTAAELYAAAAENALRLYANEEAQYCASRVLEISQDPLLRARALLVTEAAASARGNNAERLSLLQSLEQIQDLLPVEVRLEVLFRKCEVLTATSDPAAPAALEDLLAAAGDEPTFRARYLLIAGEHAHRQGEHRCAMEMLGQAAQKLRETGDAQRALAAYTSWHTAVVAAGSVQPDYIDAIALPRDASDPRTAALLASARAAALYNYDSRKAYAYAEEMLQSAQLAQDSWLEAVALRKLGSNASQMNRLSAAASYLERSAPYFLASGRPFDIANVRVHQMLTALRAAYVEGVWDWSAEASSAAIACGSVDLQMRVQSCLADADLLAGDAESFWHRTESLLATIDRFGLGGMRPGVTRGLGMHQAIFGDPLRGIETMMQAARCAEPFKMNIANYPIDIGLAYLRAGDRSKARENALQLRGRTDEVAAIFYWPHAFLWAAAHLFHYTGMEQEAEDFAASAYRRYAEILDGLTEGLMREAFLGSRYSRAVRALHERGRWSADPLMMWYSDRHVGDLGADDLPSRNGARHDEKPQAGTHG